MGPYSNQIIETVLQSAKKGSIFRDLRFVYSPVDAQMFFSAKSPEILFDIFTNPFLPPSLAPKYMMVRRLKTEAHYSMSRSIFITQAHTDYTNLFSPLSISTSLSFCLFLTSRSKIFWFASFSSFSKRVIL